MSDSYEDLIERLQKEAKIVSESETPEDEEEETNSAKESTVVSSLLDHLVEEYTTKSDKIENLFKDVSAKNNWNQVKHAAQFIAELSKNGEKTYKIK